MSTNLENQLKYKIMDKQILECVRNINPHSTDLVKIHKLDKEIECLKSKINSNTKCNDCEQYKKH